MGTKKNDTTRKCAVCGKKFTPKAVNQVYCSAACKNVAKRRAEKARKSADAHARKSPAKPATAKKPSDCTVKKALAKKDSADRLPTIKGAVCVQRIVLPKRVSDAAKLAASIDGLAKALGDLAVALI